MGLQRKDQQHHTYADYLSWPNDVRYELIDGKAYLMAPLAPTISHQTVAGEIHFQLRLALNDKPCVPLIAPVDVRLPKANEADDAIDTVVQPDVMVVCNPAKISERGVRGAPDWVVEVLSPGTASHDQINKRRTKNVQVSRNTGWFTPPAACSRCTGWKTAYTKAGYAGAGGRNGYQCAAGRYDTLGRAGSALAEAGILNIIAPVASISTRLSCTKRARSFSAPPKIPSDELQAQRIQTVSLSDSYRITITGVIFDKEIMLQDVGSHDEVYR